MEQCMSRNEDIIFDSTKAWKLLKKAKYDDTFLENFFSQFTLYEFAIKDKDPMAVISKLFLYIKPHKHNLISLYLNFLERYTENNSELIVNKECFNWVIESLKENSFIELFDLLHKIINLEINNVMVAKTENKKSFLLKATGLFSRNSPLLRHIDTNNRKWNKKEFLVFKCLNMIFHKLKEENRFIDREDATELKSLVLNTLTEIPINCLDKQYANKMVRVCLRLLRLTLDEKSLQHSEEFGTLLGIVQAYIFYEIPGFPITHPKPMVTCPLNLPVTMDPDLKRKYYRNYKTKKPGATKSIVISPKSKFQVKAISDSEISDSEAISIENPQDHNIRIEATYLLNDLVRCSRKQFTGYWMQIIASGARDNLRTLTKYIVNESVQSSLKVALNSLYELLLGSRTFLSHANDTERSSYDSVFYLLGLSIKEIYESIFYLLKKEKRILVLIKVIKCVSSLVEATPFFRLKPGLASELAKLCYPYLTHKDNTIRVKTYEIFETLILTEPLTQEIEDIFSKSSNDSLYTLSDSTHNTASETEPEEIVIDDMSECIDQINLNYIYEMQESKISAIIEMCLKTLVVTIHKEPVVIRAMMLLKAISFNAFDLIYPHLEFVFNILIEPTNHLKTDEDLWRIVFQIYRVIEVIALRLKEVKYNDKALTFWKTMFSKVISLTSHEITHLREVACDCLANIDNSILLQQINVANIVSALSVNVNDKESAVRAAAVRTFGVLVTLPSLEEDTGFLWDVQKCACIGYGDENLGVRIKAAWAIANLTEVLINRKNKMKAQSEKNESNYQETDDPNEPEPIDFINILADPYLFSISGTKDKDKVRCNAVKAIGNIIYLCQDIPCIIDTNSVIFSDKINNCYKPPSCVSELKGLLVDVRKDAERTLDKDISEYFGNPAKNNPDNFYKHVLILRYTTGGLHALINCLKKSNDMKVKWNTCRALGIILSGDPDAILPLRWKDFVFPVLTEQMCKNSNFKVRTNAAWVFTVCKSFDDKVIMVWKSILEAFENSKILSGITEYQHSEGLVQQLCLAFFHVTLYIDFKCYNFLWPEVENYMESVTPIMKRFQDKVLPEKAGDLIKCKALFSSLAQKQMNSNEKLFVEKMMDLIDNDNRFNSV